MTAPEDEQSQPMGPETPATTGLSENKASSVSPGEMLREARLAHDYSVEDLCAQTKLGAKSINALEDNDFQALSQPVFARGYYRQCAKVLDIDPDRVSKAYSDWAGEPEKTAPGSVTNINIITSDVTPGGSRFGWLLLVLVIIVAAVAILLLVSPGSETADDNDQPVATASTAAPTTDQSAASQSDTVGQTPPVTGESASNTAGAAGSGDDGPVARTGETTSGRNVNQSLGIQPPNQAGENGQGDTPGNDGTPDVPANRLELSFDKRSWVRVTDADGNRLASGIIEAGQTETYEGKAPYQIRLGFAPGVNVSIGGTPVDVAALTNGSSVANIEVAARDDGGDTDAPPRPIALGLLTR